MGWHQEEGKNAGAKTEAEVLSPDDIKDPEIEVVNVEIPDLVVDRVGTPAETTVTADRRVVPDSIGEEVSAEVEVGVLVSREDAVQVYVTRRTSASNDENVSSNNSNCKTATLGATGLLKELGCLLT